MRKDDQFDTEELYTGPILPLPSEADDLYTAADKLEELAYVVREGKSIAIRTGFLGTSQTERDPVKAAKKLMDAMELEQFEAWRDGFILPKYDWPNCKKEVTSGPKAQARFQKRALAAQEIWGDNSIDKENIAWIAANQVYVIPLIKAVAKVQAARRNLRGGQTELSEIEWAEVQTINKAVAVTMRTLNEALERLNRLNRQIAISSDILKAREHALKNKMAGRKRTYKSIST